jgi:hypothetical protein
MLYAAAPKEDELIIKLDNNGIWFHPAAQTPYSATNLPKDYFSFKSSKEIYWKIRLSYYDRPSQMQMFDVIDYFEKDHQTTWLQPKLEKDIKTYFFNKLDWLQLEKQLSTYIKNQHLRNVVFNMDTQPIFTRSSNDYSTKPYPPSQPQPYPPFVWPTAPKPTIIDATFEVLFEKATFNDGFVAATVVNGLQSLNITIANTFIKPQFDFIKLWFKKKFDKPAFKVVIKGSLLNGEFTQEYTYSEEISKINEDFIEQCRIYQVEGFLKKSKEESKKLISISDIFTKPEVAEIFNQETLNELEVINQILAIQKVRNEYQLAFLSGHSKVAAGKIMVSNAPTLGFVFCFQEESKTTFVWELLESNATYLWVFSTPNITFNAMVEVVQLEMSKIYKYHRESYLKRVQENEPFQFHRIFHTKPNETEEGKNQGLELWIANFNKLVF